MLVARDAVALLVLLRVPMINLVSGIFTGVVFLFDRWWRLYVLCTFLWSVFPAWDAVELTLRDWLHFSVHGLRPYWFKSNYELLFPEKCLETSHPSSTQIICLWWFIIKANVLLPSNRAQRSIIGTFWWIWSAKVSGTRKFKVVNRPDPGPSQGLKVRCDNSLCTPGSRLSEGRGLDG